MTAKICHDKDHADFKTLFGENAKGATEQNTNPIEPQATSSGGRVGVTGPTTSAASSHTLH